MFNVKSQNQVTINNTNYNNWVQCSESGFGKSSFFIGTTREELYGTYYFKIYLFNNSFNVSGIEVPTYLDIVLVYAYVIENGVYIWKNVITLNYALVKPKSIIYDGKYYLGYVYSPDPNQVIKITWNSIRNF